MEWQMHHHESIDSTNMEAKRLIQDLHNDNLLHGIVLTAEHQTGGKGRLGRQWESAPGTGLWCSVILKPDLPMEQASLYSFAAAVAVAEGIRQATALPALLKWPNDVLVEGKKVCGILLELVPYNRTEYYIVVGIGVNVNQRQSDFSPELHEKAASLAMLLGHVVDRQVLLEMILQRLEADCALLEQQGFAAIRAMWKALSCVMGQEVSVQQSGRELCNGVAEDLASDGALLVRTPDGMVRITVGDVSLRSKQGGYF